MESLYFITKEDKFMKSLTKKLAFCALFATLCCVSTLIVTIPLPNGYFNVGDVFVLLSGWFLGPIYGAIAAAVGSALADLWSGFALYAPATFFIKGLNAALAWLVVFLIKKLIKKESLDFISRIAGAIAGETVMVLGYFLFETVLYGLAGGTVALVGNTLQGVCCGSLAVILFSALYPIKTVRNLFSL